MGRPRVGARQNAKVGYESRRPVNKQIASDYIRTNFRPDDRVAVILLRKSDAKPPEQRVATAEQVASDRFQSFLRYRNRERVEVYISMNTIKATSNGRKD